MGVAGQFSKYVNGNTRPEPENFEKLCAGLREPDRQLLAEAYLRDTIPRSAIGLVRVERVTSAVIREEPEAEVFLIGEAKTAWQFIGKLAYENTEVREWLISTWKILK